MIDEQNRGDGQKIGENLNLYALFFKYRVYWPWFVVSVFICFIGAYVYLRYQVPVYNITSSVLIKEEEKCRDSASNPIVAILDLGMFSMTNNFDNKMEILRSRTLIKKVVCDLGLYIEIGENRVFGYSTPLYKTSPVKVYMTPEEADKLEVGIRLYMDYTKEGKLTVKVEYSLNGEDGMIEQSFDSFLAVFSTPVGVIRFMPGDLALVLGDSYGKRKINLVGYINSPTSAAKCYAENLTVEPSSKTTTIAKLSLKNTVKERGIDFIHRLVDFYNRDKNNEKNEVAQKTAEFIEEPLSDENPLSPKKRIFVLIALALGLGIPFGIVYLRDLLKYKIENREDVEKITNVSILSELPLVERAKKRIRENKSDLMEETFRDLRKNMLLMLAKGEKVILFSSTQTGEGKSFVAGNTALSLAFMGKRVVVVGMDIRKSGLNKVFNLSHRVGGISNYLIDPEHVDLLDMIQPSYITPNLDILPGGPIPPNPTELVARDVLETAIARLKERYDFIILDTAPIGMVTDTAIISRVADMCVYVCRADVTPKVGFGFINILRDHQKFKKLAVVVNGIDMSKRKNSYGKKCRYGQGCSYKTNGKSKK